MALQTSGAISLNDIQTEFGGTNPIAISEYYAAATGVPASGAISISDFYGTSAVFNETTGALTGSLLSTSGTNTAYTFKYADVSGAGGWWVRPVLKYSNYSNYTADVQLDDLRHSIYTQLYNVATFETDNDDWERVGRTTITNYESIRSSFSPILTATTTGFPNRDSGGTPSSGTGLTTAYNGSWYIYFESSTYYGGGNVQWIRGPIQFINHHGGSYPPLYSWYEARVGATCGQLDLYFEMIQPNEWVKVFPYASVSSNTSWVTYNNYSTSSISQYGYAGRSGRLLFTYVNGASGTSYQGDFQIDNVGYRNTSGAFTTLFDFEITGQGWETSTQSISDYRQVNWATIGTGTTSYRWNRDAGGTPSSGTGLSTAASGSYYLYAETSGTSTNGFYYHARSPVITLPSNFRNFEWSAGHYGGNVGAYQVYWIDENPRT